MIDLRIALALFLGFLITGFVAGSNYSDNEWQAKWDDAEKQAAQRQLELTSDAVKVYNDRIIEMEKTKDETEVKLLNASIANDNLDDANKRLQEQYELSLRRPVTCDQTITIKSDVDTETIKRELQADMFRVVSNRATEYAKIADENRIRGLSCQADYESLLRSIE